jgi:hypothetical protein
MGGSFVIMVGIARYGSMWIHRRKLRVLAGAWSACWMVEESAWDENLGQGTS